MSSSSAALGGSSSTTPTRAATWCSARSAELIDFTPFGYLRNPGHRATAWADTTGGNLRTSPDTVGVEWVYPVGRDPQTRVGLAIETEVAGRLCRTRADFDAIGLSSRYHSCLIFGFDWQIDGVQVEARFFLADDDVLAARIGVHNRALDTRVVVLRVVGHLNGEPIDGPALAEEPSVHVVIGGRNVTVKLDHNGHARIVAVLARGDDRDTAQSVGRAAFDNTETVYARLLAEDAAFYASCPTLSGDWPAHWREGLHHDFETTRLLVQPPGGIFCDVWPSWMAAWPRVVLAEGTLDMLRLAYADPSTALRAVLSLFRDAPEPNVPCIFRGGEYNMVAADGSRCGTSPAWCLPFLNLELLFLRTLDRRWLAQIYPYAAAYVEWWLEHRVDAEGWLVYRCTWESGEDGNPRLDPSESGDADISGRLRPVELQATMAHAASVMAFFASELGRAQDIPRWRQLEEDFRERTRKLFDPATGRYRDWLIAEGRFQEPCPNKPYWGIDACRYSAQSLTPLLIGEPLAEEEAWRHASPPWTLWPSWTASLVESAAAAGLYAGTGALACETIDRVYRVTTRRELGSFTRPLPGSAPEFWPADWRTYGGSDAYGWGATTANLLIRHLFGFKEARVTDGWVAELAPAFPAIMLGAGQRYAVSKLNYRGLQFDLSYTVLSDGLLAHLDLYASPRQCTVHRAGDVLYASPAAASSHTFAIANGAVTELRLH